MRSFTKLNMTRMESDIRSINFEPVYTSVNANMSLNYFLNSLQYAILKNTYTTDFPRKFNCIKPWITPGLVRCIRNRDKLHQKSKLSPENEIGTHFNV